MNICMTGCLDWNDIWHVRPNHHTRNINFENWLGKPGNLDLLSLSLSEQFDIPLYGDRIANYGYDPDFISGTIWLLVQMCFCCRYLLLVDGLIDGLWKLNLIQIRDQLPDLTENSFIICDVNGLPNSWKNFSIPKWIKGGLSRITRLDSVLKWRIKN